MLVIPFICVRRASAAGYVLARRGYDPKATPSGLELGAEDAARLCCWLPRWAVA